MEFGTCRGFPPRCDSVAGEFDWACPTERKEEGRHCTAAEGGARPGLGAPPAPGHRGVAVAMADRHGDDVAPGCAGVPAERRGPEWAAALFSERSCIFDGSLYLPRGGS